MAKGIHKICYTLFLIAGILYLIGSLMLPMGTIEAPRSGLFPLLVAIFIIAMSLLPLKSSFKEAKESEEQIEPFPKGPDRNRVLAIATALLLFAFCLKPFGYLIPTICLMAVIVRLMGLQSWVKVALAGIITGVISFYLFAFILEVPLPRGEVFP